MCVIEQMRAQAREDMAAYRAMWGEGANQPYTREMAEANLGHIIERLPVGEFTTHALATALGVNAKCLPATLTRLQRANVIEKCGEYQKFDGNRSSKMAPIWRKIDA